MLRPRAKRHRDLHRLPLELVEDQIGAEDGLLRFRSAIVYRGVARHGAARLVRAALGGHFDDLDTVFEFDTLYNF
jgi:hypothetical protein